MCAPDAAGSSDPPAGFLLVDKPVGPSSFDVVARVRRALPRGTKVGHAGTLDPFASGLLVVLVGVATRLMPWVVGHDKRYLLDAAFGATSSTDDVTGDVQFVGERSPLDRSRLDAAIEAERLRTEQVPPQVSAIHVDGERAYRVARRGQHVDVAARAVSFDVIDVVESHLDGAAGDTSAAAGLPSVRLDVRCSTGTYLRSLARDIGDRLDMGGLATGLRRTEVGRWSVVDALVVPADQDERSDSGELLRAMHGIDDLLHDAPIAQLEEGDAVRLAHGGRIPAARLAFVRGDAPAVRGTTAAPDRPQDEKPVVLRSQSGVVLGVGALVHGIEGAPIVQPRVVDPTALARLTPLGKVHT